MSEQDQSSSKDLEKADSGFTSDDVKENGEKGHNANEQDVGLEESGQQELEKSGTAESHTSERDPKLVYTCFFPCSDK